jgi:hypothetical protein
MWQIMPDFSSTHSGEPTYGFSIPLCTKVNFCCIAMLTWAETCGAADIFYVMGRSKLRQQSIDLLSCRVGCEFITITISIARREAAENFLSSAASIGSHHTIAELAQCSLINCWSHAQNVARGPWPSMQGKGDGRRKRP